MNRSNCISKVFLILNFITLIVPSWKAFADTDRVELRIVSPPTISAGSSLVRFELVNLKDGFRLTDSQLRIGHEKKLHLLSYDPSLTEFQHVHPEFDGTVWTVSLNYNVNGDYHLWAQGVVDSDSAEFTAGSRLEVIGGTSSRPPPTLADLRAGSDSGSTAKLSSERLRSGKMAMLKLTLLQSDGSPAEITPYLGAFAHVIATPEDGLSLTHVHPVDGSKGNEGTLHVTFGAAGFYRIWVQFIDRDVLKTIPLSVEVWP